VTSYELTGNDSIGPAPQLPNAVAPAEYGYEQPGEKLTYWRAHAEGLVFAAQHLTADPSLWETDIVPRDPDLTHERHTLIGNSVTLLAQMLLRAEVAHDNDRVELAKSDIRLAQSEYERMHDPKTGLLNEVGLEDALTRIDDPSRYSFVYADAVNFRAVDQLLGEEKVNILFKAMAEVLQESLRRGDALARIYGDTYVALAYNDQSTGDRRKGVSTQDEMEAAMRKRVERHMNSMLEEHPDAEAVGFDLAVGSIPYDPTLSLPELIDISKAHLQPYKDHMHALHGEFRPKQRD
jgi:GGDEF domain-containing protein